MTEPQSCGRCRRFKPEPLEKGGFVWDGRCTAHAREFGVMATSEPCDRAESTGQEVIA